MVDTHCHLLPDLDDGPPNMGAAVALAGHLREAGITRVLCTPHFSRQFPTDHDLAMERLHALRKTLSEARIDLDLDLAAEVSPGMAVSASSEDLSTRAIAGRFLLLEVQDDTTEAFLQAAAERIASLGLVSVLAHPERGRTLRRHFEALEAQRESGALVQVVAPSLVGRAGPDVEAAAWELVVRGLADLVASDAHGSWRSPADLTDAADRLDARVGEDRRVALTAGNPARLLAGQYPHKPPQAS